MILDPAAPVVAYLVTPRLVPDTYGESMREEWDGAVETDLPGAQLQAQSTTERTSDGTARVVSTATLYIPGTPDIAPTDRVRVGTVTYRVAGAPLVHTGRMSLTTYTAVPLVRVTGAQ